MSHTIQKGRSLWSAFLSFEWLGRLAERYSVVGMMVCGVYMILTQILAIILDPDHYGWMVSPKRIFSGVTYAGSAIFVAYVAIMYLRNVLRTRRTKSQPQPYRGIR